jgi:cellulose synthase/poly-beta-1,6-N-acetylglucosamine synthase-like glycosyltransferase
MDARVVILIDNFNYGRFLGPAITSALEQTYEHCQVVVVDDGSEDDSRAVIATFGDQITPVFKVNGGQASAINAGYAAATGDIWFMLDADDVLETGIVESAVAEFERFPAAARVQFPLRLIDRVGKPLQGTVPRDSTAMPSGDLIDRMLFQNDDLAWAPMSGNAYRADVLQSILPIPIGDYPDVGADLYLINMSTMHGPVRSLTQIGGGYRVHGANADYRNGLDADRSKRIVLLSETTHRHLAVEARRLGIDERRISEIGCGSLTLMAHRMIVARLGAPPAPTRERMRLAVMGWRSAWRRSDVSLHRRAAYCGWLGAMAIAPKVLARSIGNLPFRG